MEVFLKTPRLKFYGVELTVDQLTRFLSIVGGPSPSHNSGRWRGLYDHWQEDLKRPFRRRGTTPANTEEFIFTGLMAYEKQDPVDHYYTYVLTELGFNYISRVVHANMRICKYRTSGFIRRQRKHEKAQARKAALTLAEHPAPSV